MGKLDLSNHISGINLDEPLVATTAVDVSSFLPPQEEWNKDAGPRKTKSLFGTTGRSRSIKSPGRIFENLIEEEAHKAVSCATIEANLLSDSNCRQDNFNDNCSQIKDQEYDESYWDVPSLEEKVLSTGEVEKLLVQDSKRRDEERKQKKPFVEDNHPNNAYWDWPSEPVQESTRKSNVIESIIHEDSIRQQLTIGSITALEVSNTSNSDDPQIESLMPSEHMSVDYWCWNTEEDAKVEEEQKVAPNAHDSQFLKETLIDTILKSEHIRKLLRADAVEAREVEFHRTREGHAKKEQHCAPTNDLEAVPSNYWDYDSVEPNSMFSIL